MTFLYWPAELTLEGTVKSLEQSCSCWVPRYLCVCLAPDQKKKNNTIFKMSFMSEQSLVLEFSFKGCEEHQCGESLLQYVSLQVSACWMHRKKFKWRSPFPCFYTKTNTSYFIKIQAVCNKSHVENFNLLILLYPPFICVLLRVQFASPESPEQRCVGYCWKTCCWPEHRKCIDVINFHSVFCFPCGYPLVVGCRKGQGLHFILVATYWHCVFFYFFLLGWNTDTHTHTQAWKHTASHQTVFVPSAMISAWGRRTGTNSLIGWLTLNENSIGLLACAAELEGGLFGQRVCAL